MNNPFKKFFEVEKDEPTGMSEANDVLSFASHPYYEKGLMSYLERGADEPLDSRNADAVIRSAERINTFKSIRAHLRKQVTLARALMDRENSDG